MMAVAQARVWLGVGEDDFLASSPAYVRMLWEEFRRKHEYDVKRGDMLVARIMALVANCNRDPKRTKAFTEEDFMPREKPQVDSTTLLAKWELIVNGRK